VYVTLIVDAEPYMKLICERTTFIPGFCVFLLHHKGFGGVSTTPARPDYTTLLIVTRNGSVSWSKAAGPAQCQDVIGTPNALDRDPEIDLADRNLDRFAVPSWPFNPPVDRLAAPT
jgi:hypothetical protein